MFDDIKESLTEKQVTIFSALKNHSQELLDNTPRFKYFTLHGQQHINNLLNSISLLRRAGLNLNQEQLFLLCCAICIHDIGMVIPLKDLSSVEVFGGKPQTLDPANLELQIRQMHHDLIDKYIETHFDFLSKLGLTVSDCAILQEISRCHRKIDLSEKIGFVKTLGAVLRVIDELDISPSRAPASVLTEQYHEMDATSCWHWYKHNLCEDWREGHNAIVEKSTSNKINFIVAVHPQKKSSIPYWINQIKRPILRVLVDEGGARIILENWNFQIGLQTSQELSSPLSLGNPWDKIEEKALSAGRKVILVIDDEVRKLEDLFLSLMQDYYVIFAPHAKDALDKLAAGPVDLAIVDLQIGSGFQWSAGETNDFKMTGKLICKEIQSKYSNTSYGILTGSRHDIAAIEELSDLKFVLRKPIDPDVFEQEVRRVLTQ